MPFCFSIAPPPGGQKCECLTLQRLCPPRILGCASKRSTSFFSICVYFFCIISHSLVSLACIYFTVSRVEFPSPSRWVLHHEGEGGYDGVHDGQVSRISSANTWLGASAQTFIYSPPFFLSQVSRCFRGGEGLPGAFLCDTRVPVQAQGWGGGVQAPAPCSVPRWGGRSRGCVPEEQRAAADAAAVRVLWEQSPM